MSNPFELQILRMTAIEFKYSLSNLKYVRILDYIE